MNIPTHVAAIPDGNRRWAKERGLPGPQGHVEGMKKFGEVAKEAFRLGVNYFTFWAASESNLKKRTKEEVAILMMLFREEIVRQLHAKEFDEIGVRVRVYGKGLDILGDKKFSKAVRDLESESSKYKDKQLTVLFGYNGTTELLEAIAKLTKDPTGTQDPREAEGVLRKYLWTGELPDVDLVIRTGSAGDPHNSAGFMMWLTKESQLYFTDMYWPDFGRNELRQAIEEYAQRERRLGK